MHALADRSGITGIAARKTPKPVINPETSLSVAQAIQPFAELLRLENDDLSFIQDRGWFVNVFQSQVVSQFQIDG